MKKLFYCLAAVLFIVILSSTQAFAVDIIDSGYCGDEGDGTNLIWTLDANGDLTISGSGAIAGYALNTLPWANYCNSIKHVEILEGVTAIGSQNFYNCVALETVNLPESLTVIGNYAFYNCSALGAITFSKALTSIGDYAFCGCADLSSLSIPDSVTKIGIHAFNGCTKLATIDLSKGITAVDDFSFAGCRALTALTIPNGVTYIGEAAFAQCKELTEITIPSSVGEIGWRAFVDCSGLSKITFEGSAPVIDENAFESVITGVKVTAYYPADNETWTEEKLQNYGGNITWVMAAPEVIASGTCGANLVWSFDETGTLTISGSGEMDNYSHNAYAPWYDHKSNIKSIVVENGVSSIGSYAFFRCWYVETIELPDTLLEIGGAAFVQCQHLVSIDLNEGLLSIGKDAFDYCASLPCLTIPSTVEEIKCDFYSCHALVSIDVDPENKNYSSEDGILFNKGKTILLAYPADKDDTSYSIPDSVESFDTYAFWRANFESVRISAKIENVGSYPFNSCDNLKEILVDPSNISYCTQDGVLFTKDMLKLVYYPINKADERYTVPEGVTTIVSNAFDDCVNIKIVVFPASLTTINSYAFDGCSSLEYLAIPEGITEIKGSTFRDCTNLKEIIIPNSVTTIGSYAFDSCSQLATVHIYPNTEFTVNNTGNTCFSNADHHYLSVTNAAESPSCIKSGNTASLYCSECAKTVVEQQPLSALGHHLICHEAQAPTCTEIGWDAYEKCSRCDYTTYVERDALGHDAQHHDAKTATCTEIGWNTYEYCSRCDYTTYVEDAALGHDTVNHEAQAPTCTEIGWSAYETCARKGCDYTSYVEKSKLGHDEAIHDAKAPTCTEVGWNTYVTCSRCDYSTYEEIPATGNHAWNNWSYTDTTTHSRTCAVCKTTEAQNHDLVAGLCSVCDKDTLSAVVQCSGLTIACEDIENGTRIICAGYDTNGRMDCSAIFIWDGTQSAPTLSVSESVSYVKVFFVDESYVPLRNAYTIYRDNTWSDHHYVESSHIDPTCTKSGQKVFTCSNCGDTYTEELSATGHTEVVDISIASTCTKTGLTEGTHCSVCDETIVSQTVVPALGHTEVIDEAVSATCTSTGLTEGKHCGICKEVLVTQAIVPTTEHQWSVASCTVPKTCAICKKTDGNAPGHTWGNWLLLNDAMHSRCCSVCNSSETGEHSFVGSYCTECSPNSANTKFAGGRGTIDDPYLISTKAQLNAVRNNLSAHYALINDIIFTAEDFLAGGSFYNNGAGWIPIGLTASKPFTGSFNGYMYEVSGLVINAKIYSSNDTPYIGLFGCSSGSIRNLFLSGTINADGDDVTVGGIIGHNNGVIDYCYNEASISVGDETAYNAYSFTLLAGGIAGSNSGIISNCSNSAAIGCGTNYHDLIAWGYSGGIAGTNSGNILNCYNTANITCVTRSRGSYVNSISNSGGITGFNSAAITECFNSGDIFSYAINNNSSTSYSGGLAGRNTASATVSNSFNAGDITTSANSSYAGGIVGSNSHTEDSPNKQVSYCYNIGTISGGFTGGIVGYSYFSDDLFIKYDTPIYYCVYLLGESCVGKSTTSNDTMACRSESITSMTQRSTFYGFDFDTVWIMDTGEYELPLLRWFANRLG